ncbi:MAG: outer membrane lipoprotein LolB [Aquabacterium sp.]|nr:outer membrane lipoprotein LolB [Aquabacterium sp.]
MSLAVRRWRSILSAAVLTGGLAGCASLAPPVEGEVLSGRLSIRVDGQPDRSVSGGFELSGTARQGGLVLSGPLGTTALRASWAPGAAVLAQPGGGETRYADLDALARATLGEAIPMAALFDWLRGRAWSGAPASARADGGAGFEQLGWQISLQRWGEGALEAVRVSPPMITVRARVEPRS